MFSFKNLDLIFLCGQFSVALDMKVFSAHRQIKSFVFMFQSIIIQFVTLNVSLPVSDDTFA